MELMLIREVEERCGISKKNIRFYEQQGLLQPKRNASNYREYEEADLIVLKKIILLRKLDFSLEEIHQILQDETAFAPLLEQRKASLIEAGEQVVTMKKICMQLETTITGGNTLTEELCDDFLTQIATKTQSTATFYDLAQDAQPFPKIDPVVARREAYVRKSLQHSAKKSQQYMKDWNSLGKGMILLPLLLLCFLGYRYIDHKQHIKNPIAAKISFTIADATFDDHDTVQKYLDVDFYIEDEQGKKISPTTSYASLKKNDMEKRLYLKKGNSYLVITCDSEKDTSLKDMVPNSFTFYPDSHVNRLPDGAQLTFTIEQFRLFYQSYQNAGGMFSKVEPLKPYCETSTTCFVETSKYRIETHYEQEKMEFLSYVMASS